MPKLTLINAILFVPAGVGIRWLEACHQYAQQRGYKVVSIVRTWNDLLSMTRAGKATVVVAGRPDHLPPDRTPRIEFVTDAPVEAAPEQRRPSRRSAAR